MTHPAAGMLVAGNTPGGRLLYAGSRVIDAFCYLAYREIYFILKLFIPFLE
jgi:hypothetical protein